jgi:urate oxidase
MQGTPAGIAHAAYGKADVRVLTRIPSAAGAESGGGDTVRDVLLAVQVEGDFHESYESGVNSAILPSDTLRRHALAECDRQPHAGAEELLDGIGRRILAANPAFTAVTGTVQIRRWQRIGLNSFVDGVGRGWAEVRLAASPGVTTPVPSAVGGAPGAEPTRAVIRTRVTGGVRGLAVLTTTGSAFTGFLRDGLTTQEAATDRPLCGTLDADWTFRAGELPGAELADAIVARVLAAFADRPSNAVQELLTAVGSEVLAGMPDLAGIALRFDSLPTAPLPAELATARTNGGRSYEVGAGAVGVTEVGLKRAI